MHAFMQLFASVAQEFNQAFINNGNYANAQQIAMALPLLLGIVPASLNATSLFEELIDNIVQANVYHVTTVWLRLLCVTSFYCLQGIIGLKGLFYSLTDGGRLDIGLALAEQVR